MAAVHGRALLADAVTARVVTADARRPAEVLGDPGVRDFIDFSCPVGLLMFAILHHITDAEDPAAVTAQFRGALAPGSYLAISSVRMPGPEHPQDAEKARAVQDLFNEKLGTGLWREDAEILAWFGDWELLEPRLGPAARMASRLREPAQPGLHLPRVRRRSGQEAATPGPPRGYSGCQSVFAPQTTRQGW